VAKQNKLPKQTWYDKGVKAAARAFKEIGDVYVCPLCMRGIDRDHIDWLTCEDVPPKLLGGRPLLLTCCECNNNHGAFIDSELAKFVNFEKFLGQVPGSAFIGRMKIDEGEVNARFRWAEANGERRLEISDYALLNPPHLVDTVNQALGKLVPREFEVTLRTYKGGFPEISLLRAAYLATFAKFGYGFVCRPIFADVRRQINEPETEILRHYYLAGQDNPSRPFMLAVVTRPEWARSLLVQIRAHRIVLPLWDDDDVYTRIAAARQRGENAGSTKVTAQILQWPNGPEHLIDFEPEQTIKALRFFTSRASSGAQGA
jgi:hypothetical protein